MPALDPIALAQALIRCPSVTPADAGALDVLQATLQNLGFVCHRLPFGEGAARVDNLYARLGTARPHFCFAGHTDVVPVGNLAEWTVDPFAAVIENGMLFGRGAADMKGAIAAFAVAVDGFVRQHGQAPGSISLLITGDEEGVAENGTVKMLEWLEERGEIIDHCVVGEPTNPARLGDMIKIGRRGSLNAALTVMGARGHVAYPHLADNPIPRLLDTLRALQSHRLDDGTAHFDPSNLEITSVDVGNAATNVIPATATARLNIRFNDLHTGASLSQWIRDVCAAHAGAHEVNIHVSGEAFLTQPGFLSDLVAAAVHDVTGRTPELSTTGGTSDSRFIKNMCPVLDFGLVGKTMHKADERAALADIQNLTLIYRRVLERYFDAPEPR